MKQIPPPNIPGIDQLNILGIKEKKVDGLVPVTKEDFEQFGKAISEKIQMFSSSEHYSELIENITKEICIDRKLLKLVMSSWYLFYA